MIHQLIASLLPYLPKKFVWLFSSRYISGRNIEDAIESARRLSESGAMATIDYLGEFVTNMEQAKKHRDVYLILIKQFSKEKIDVSLSLKPNGFGLLINNSECYELIREVVTYAAGLNMMIRIDMEDSKCVDKEIALYKRLHGEFPANVGLAIQAYLKRTESDLKTMLQWHLPETPLNFRLCKGIYQEPPQIAYKNPQEINTHFLKDLELLARNKVYIGIATHDKVLVKGAFKIIEKYSLQTDQYEFQMLLGVTPELRSEIINKGHRLRVYIPFGEEWFAYSMRRLKENPKMVGQIIKALFFRG